MGWGRRLGGLLPAHSLYNAADAASLSPLSHAARPGLPPVMMFVGRTDAIVPSTQQLLFASRAREAGHKPCVLVFDEADHGGGGYLCATGRKAMLEFLQSVSIDVQQPDSDRVAFVTAVAKAVAPQALGEYEELGEKTSDWLLGEADFRLA